MFVGGQQLTYPVQGPFIDIALGDYHTCGLRPDGSVACWSAGENEMDVGQLTPPTGVVFRSIASGGQHNCGLDIQGNIHCWGAGTSDFGQEPDYGQSIPPSGTFSSLSWVNITLVRWMKRE